MIQKNQNKTIATDNDVQFYLNNIEDVQKREDSINLDQILRQITKEGPIMWGKTIVGYGSYHYVYDSGREGDMCRSGFSARKNALTVYCMNGFSQQENLLKQLGKHKLGKSCLYIKKLSDIDIDILAQIIQKDWDYMNKKYPH